MSVSLSPSLPPVHDSATATASPCFFSRLPACLASTSPPPLGLGPGVHQPLFRVESSQNRCDRFWHEVLPTLTRYYPPPDLSGRVHLQVVGLRSLDRVPCFREQGPREVAV